MNNLITGTRMLKDERKPEAVDTVLFLGAGASSELGYPTSSEFRAELWGEIESEEARWIAERSNNIDETMRNCRDIIDHDCSCSIFKERLYASLEKEAEEKIGIRRRGEEVYNSIKEAASILEEKITSLIYKKYAYREVTVDNYLREYIELLRKRDVMHLPVFTTNYDPVIEHLEGYEINTLFEHKKYGRFQWKGEDAYKTGPVIINLFKLHGSVCWYWDKSRLFEDRTTRTSVRAEEERNERSSEMVQPGMLIGDRRMGEPYSTYLSYFDEYLTKATHFVIIGYRFDDSEIQKEFTRRKNLRIITVNPEEHYLKGENVEEIRKKASEAVGDVEAALEAPAHQLNDSGGPF